MLASLLPFLLALARALPAADDLFRRVVLERDKDREREAAARLQAKDAAVDAAIDNPDAVEGEHGPGA